MIKKTHEVMRHEERGLVCRFNIYLKERSITLETAPPTPGSIGGDDNLASIQNQDPMRKPTTINGVQG